MAFTTLDEVKLTLRHALIDTDSADFDTALQQTIDAAQSAVQNFCGRSFDLADGTETTQHYQVPRLDSNAELHGAAAIYRRAGVAVSTGNNHTPLRIDDVANPATITITGNGLTWRHNAEITGSYTPEVGGVVSLLWQIAGNSWSDIADTNGRIAVAADYGWRAVPAAVKEATKLWAARLYKRQDSGDALLGMTGGDDSRYVRAIDPDIANLLRPYAAGKLSVG